MKHPPDCTITTTRTFDFPRALVYKAWADDALLKNWWGPNGFTNTFNLFDFRVGGQWSFIMHGPDKGHYHNECTFREIREPEFIAWDRQSKPLFRVEATFEEISPSKTKVTFCQIFDTAEECGKIRPYVIDKNEENMDRLAAELLVMQVSGS